MYLIEYSSVEKLEVTSAGKSYVALVEKDKAQTDYALGAYLATALENTTKEIKSVSVFEAELDFAAAVVGNVGGTDVNSTNTDDYWVIVITTE